MKLKYYLRGLGAGMIISTVSLSLVLGKKTYKAMSDAEIIEKAKELGMEMKRVNVNYDAIDEELKKDNNEAKPTKDDTNINVNIGENITNDNQDTTDSTEKNNESEGESNDKFETDKETDQANKEEVSSDQESSRPEREDQNDPNADEKNNPQADEKNGSKEDTKNDSVEKEKESKTITITPGMTAKQVCNLLEDKGVIESADDFNLYLIKHKLTEKIISNKYEIKMNSKFKTIAKIITEY